MNQIEQQALDMLVAGDDPLLMVLRSQLARAAVESREFTGVGFFTNLTVPGRLERIAGRPNLVLGDVYAELDGLRNPAGFLLFVEAGSLHCLECFIVDDEWPPNPAVRRMYYVHEADAGDGALVETPRRDLEWALRSGPGAVE